jgi:hypothetical protein
VAATQALRVDNLGVVLKATYSETNDNGAVFPADILDTWLIALNSGTGSGNANFLYRKQYTILAAALEAINLKSLIDEFSNTVTTFSKLKLLAIRLYSSDDAAATIEIGGTTSGNNFSAIFKDPTDKFVLPVGGIYFFGVNTTGLTVDATHRILDILNTSATKSVVVDVRAIGEK